MITIQEFNQIKTFKAELKQRAKKGEGNPSVQLNKIVLMWHTPHTPNKEFRYCLDYKGMTWPVSEIDLHNLAKGRLVLG